MLYFSAEAKLLRLAHKVYNQVPGVYERFITDGKLDIQKAKDVFVEQGWNRQMLNNAASILLGLGYLNANGITATGIAKVEQMETARLARMAELGLTEDLASNAVYDPVKIAQLNATDL